MRSRSTYRIPLLVALISLPAAGCGDGDGVSLDNHVDVDLFTDIVQQVNGAASYTQRATIRLSPTLSEADVAKITRLRLVHELAGDWLIEDPTAFVAGEGGWTLVDERSANRDVRTGAWDLRMVVEEEGVHVEDHLQHLPGIGVVVFDETSVTPGGAVSIAWTSPSVAHDWVVQLIRRTYDGEAFTDEVISSTNGIGRGSGRVSVGFGVDPALFEPPSEARFRLEMVNTVSRRVVEAPLTPSGG